MRFNITWREVANLIISVSVLGLLFSMRDLNNIIPITLIVGLAFIVHELSHKVVAEHFDCKTEYVVWPQGILISVVIGLLSRGSIIFAALGYVSIQSYYSTRLGYHFTHLSLEEIGKISASGPVSNIILGIISAMIAPYFPIMGYSATLNFIIALFNLVPFPPLDGSKVIMWSRIAWISLLISTIAIFSLSFLINPIMAGLIGLAVMLGMIFYTFYKGF